MSKEWDFFNSRVCYAIGDKKRVKVWKDSQCNKDPLNEMFPNLFALSKAKQTLVVDLWEEKEGEGGLELLFCQESKSLEVGYCGEVPTSIARLIDVKGAEGQSGLERQQQKKVFCQSPLLVESKWCHLFSFKDYLELLGSP